ncbi:MAG: hypothetical protein ACRBFS_22135 [Aureispira sp.]
MQTPKIMNAFFLLSFLSGLFSSCESTIVEKQYLPNTEGVTANIDLVRFDQAFFNLDTTQLATSLGKLQERYPAFTTGYLQSFLNASLNPRGLQRIQGFLRHPDTRYTYDTIQQVFDSLPEVQQQIQELATHYSYYFPEQPPLTKAYTYLSDYHGDRLAILESGLLGLPLDMALGAGYTPYVFLKLPNYDQRTCTREHLVSKAADATAQNLMMLYGSSGGTHLLDLMLYNGKVFYLADILLPSTADSLKFGFSSHQMDYMKKGELKLYEYLSNEELMYESETKRINKFITKGPFKPHLDLPGNSGSWLGFKMVQSYMAELRQEYKKAQPNANPRSIDIEILQKMLKETDPQQFLLHYKPPKR